MVLSLPLWDGLVRQTCKARNAAIATAVAKARK